LRRIFVAPPARALEPVRVAGVEPGTRRRRETPVRHLTGERMDERVAIAVLAHEGTSGERSERRLALDKGAQRLDPNVRPITAAAWSADFSVGASRSMRAARRACTVS